MRNKIAQQLAEPYVADAPPVRRAFAVNQERDSMHWYYEIDGRQHGPVDNSNMKTKQMSKGGFVLTLILGVATVLPGGAMAGILVIVMSIIGYRKTKGA